MSCKAFFIFSYFVVASALYLYIPRLQCTYDNVDNKYSIYLWIKQAFPVCVLLQPLKFEVWWINVECYLFPHFLFCIPFFSRISIFFLVLTKWMIWVLKLVYQSQSVCLLDILWRRLYNSKFHKALILALRKNFYKEA